MAILEMTKYSKASEWGVSKENIPTALQHARLKLAHLLDDPVPILRTDRERRARLHAVVAVEWNGIDKLPRFGDGPCNVGWVVPDGGLCQKENNEYAV